MYRSVNATRAVLLTSLLLTACFGGSRKSDQDGFPDVVPVDVHAVPNAVPKAEPRSRYGNPSDYEVFGKRYFVLKTAEGYKERGDASWYGTKFHGRRTSSGEPYDMFAMTAAHKTLPLPTYVRVTHLGNGRSVVVRVNDRGPFHPGRIIDLSYAAAAQLDLLASGSAAVEVETLDPESPAPSAVNALPAFLELGRYRDAIEAVSIREQAADLGLQRTQIRTVETAQGTLHRVLVGPFDSASSYQTTRQRLADNGLAATPVTD